ncbi:unnamed protein product [Nippostrongylus brasiliensis]|uniref:Pigment dispersing factor 1b (inferred by orthology to a C. elegans protein) n=1 Tax=Nippostrongylus brasiliensis TaxID=27835 RepID=A0A0N4Y4L5_NIPBR|nr:unnamed protein product [Nippostrongylus brasiliensis]
MMNVGPGINQPDPEENKGLVFDDTQFVKRSNAELINGLIGMDLGKLSAVGKRSNAELINGLLGMNLNKLSSAGRR